MSIQSSPFDWGLPPPADQNVKICLACGRPNPLDAERCTACLNVGAFEPPVLCPLCNIMVYSGDFLWHLYWHVFDYPDRPESW